MSIKNLKAFKEELKNQEKIAETDIPFWRRSINIVIASLVVVALPVTILLINQVQDIRQRASESDNIKLVFSPSGIQTELSPGEKIPISVLAYTANNDPLFDGVTYEWGISSSNSIGTLSEVAGSIASFIPQNNGVGDIFVTANVAGTTVTGSISVSVGQTLPPICSSDVKICPDGSTVSRTGPNCEFEPCPSPLPPTPTPTAIPSFSGYRGEYFANNSLLGTPAIIRDDASIEFDWKRISPDSLIPNDNFSVRWTKSENFTAGNYRFRIRSDDGMRVTIDGTTYYNKWDSKGLSTGSFILNIAGGNHTIVVEYREQTGNASASLDWTKTK